MDNLHNRFCGLGQNSFCGPSRAKHDEDVMGIIPIALPPDIELLIAIIVVLVVILLLGPAIPRF